MPDLTLVILAAGNSTRFGSKTKKQWIRIEKEPLWLFVANKFKLFHEFKKIIITGSKQELFYMRNHASFTFVQGGESRQESIKNALKEVDSEYVLVTDVARACLPKDMVENIISHKNKADIIVPYIGVSDTVVYENETIDRDKVKLIQTPQLSKTSVLKKALSQKELYTDDSSAIKSIGGTVFYTKGSINAKKITRYDDLVSLACLRSSSRDIFVGTGFDVHQFCDNKKMFLGGVEIKTDNLGFKAHSDGDVALHALIDALLGGIGASDIGELYPDNDDQFKDIDSSIMLTEVSDFIRSVGYEINNVDITIMAQTPRISSYKEEMRNTIASILEIEPIFVNIKATTTEKLGFIGRKEGVAVEAIASLKYNNWMDK